MLKFNYLNRKEPTMYFCRPTIDFKHFGKIVKKPRSVRFMAGTTAFFIFVTGAIGGFCYRDWKSPEITKARELEIMKNAVDKCQKEANRRAKAMLEDNREKGAGR